MQMKILQRNNRHSKNLNFIATDRDKNKGEKNKELVELIPKARKLG